MIVRYRLVQIIQAEIRCDVFLCYESGQHISRTSGNVGRREHDTFLEVRRMCEDETCIAHFHGSG